MIVLWSFVLKKQDLQAVWIVLKIIRVVFAQDLILIILDSWFKQVMSVSFAFAFNTYSSKDQALIAILNSDSLGLN